MATEPPAQKLSALTSLRFFAASGIVVLHCGGHFGFPADLTRGHRIPLYLGVSFFFVLSGFILTYVYPKLESAEARHRFLFARFARVWPCHILALVLFCLINGVTIASIREKGLVLPYLANIGMVHAWIPLKAFYYAGNNPSWSISAEFGFYFLFPLLIWRLDRTWHVKLACCLLLDFLALAACQRFQVPYDSETSVTTNGLLYMNPLSRVSEFALGMTTAYFWRIYSPRIRLGRAAGTLVELVAVALVAIHAYSWTDIANWIMKRTGTSSQLQIFFSHWTTCLSFAVLVFVAAMGRGWLTRALSWSVFVLLGEISYALYLIHFPLLGYVHHHKASFAAYPNWMVFAGFAIVSLALSHAIWVLVEGPARRSLLRLWPKPGATGDATRPAFEGRRPWRTPTPTGLILVAELLLVASVVYVVERRPYSILSDRQAVALRVQGRPEARDIRFGDRYLLRDVLLSETQGGIKVGLMWQSQRSQPLDCYVVVNLCDREGRVLNDLSYIQDPRQRPVGDGTIWLEEKLIPRQQIDQAGGSAMTSVAIAIGPIVRAPNQDPVYHPESGPRDHGNWRVMLRTAEMAQAPSDVRIK